MNAPLLSASLSFTQNPLSFAEFFPRNSLESKHIRAIDSPQHFTESPRHLQETAARRRLRSVLLGQGLHFCDSPVMVPASRCVSLAQAGSVFDVQRPCHGKHISSQASRTKNQPKEEVYRADIRGPFARTSRVKGPPNPGKKQACRCSHP